MFLIFCYSSLNGYEKINLTQEEKKYLQTLKLKRDFPKEEWKPFYYYGTEHKNLGIVEDYWDLIKSKLQLKEIITQKHYFFPNIIQRIKENKTDIYPSTSYTKQRAKFAYFSKPFEKFPIGIVTLTNDSFMFDAKSLEDRKVAVAKDTTAYFLMKKKYPSMKFIQVDTIKDAIEKVKNNQAYAAIDILPVLKHNINRYGDNKISFSGIADVTFNMQVMISKKHAKLLPLINKAIDSITPQERLDILKKRMDIEIVEKTNYTLIKNITLILGGGFFIIIFWNITLRKKIKEEINKFKQQESALIHQSRKAEVGEVLGAITHQMKQSLNIVNIVIADMQFKFLTQDIDKIDFESYFEKILKQTNFMSHTIDDFKNFFTKKQNDEKFDTQIALRKIIQMFEGIFIRKRININIYGDKEYFISACENELMQVYLILLNNAKDAILNTNKATREINCYFDIQDESLFITIEDNGGGIPNELLPDEIFKSHVSTKTEGMGIGLSLCKTIIKENMKGKIEVHNSTKGAVFTLQIPIDKK